MPNVVFSDAIVFGALVFDLCEIVMVALALQDIQVSGHFGLVQYVAENVAHRFRVLTGKLM